MSEETLATGRTASVRQSIAGVARIIIDPSKDIDKFKTGDILIAHHTDIAYYPLMLRACAFIGEVGGICCHMASVARELNKIAVVGATGVIDAIQDGEWIIVDGVTGKILRRGSD